MALAEHEDRFADENFDIRPRFVRVTGKRKGFVEFDFAIGEPDIHVEMILSEQGFAEFCTINQVTMLEPGEHAHEKVEDLGFEWRLSDATGRRARQEQSLKTGEQ